MANVHLISDDPGTREVARALAPFAASRPAAEITVRRASPVSIHVRVVDSGFAGRDRVGREEDVWPLLERLPDETFTQITVLLLLTPRESPGSHANELYFGSGAPVPAEVP